jgi:enoyl-CoA hydratase
MIRFEVRDHVAEIIIDNPPVNALPVAGWFELADAIKGAGRDADVRAVIVAANPELRAFQVGVDIKEHPEVISSSMASCRVPASPNTPTTSRT